MTSHMQFELSNTFDPYKALEILILVVGVVIFSIICLQSVENIPTADDYAWSIEFYTGYSQATHSSLDKLKLLWENIAEHRVFGYKLATVLSKSILGDIDFKWIVHTGNVFYLLFVLLFHYHLRSIFKSRKELVFISAISMSLLLVPLFVLNTFAISAIVQPPLMLLALIAFIKASSLDSFLGVLILSILSFICCALFGNGLFVLPICFLILLFRKKIVKGILYAFIGLIIYYFYFLNHPEFGSSQNSEIFQFSINTFYGLLIFVGSPIKTLVGYSLLGCGVIGGVLLVSWVIIGLKSIFETKLYPTLAIGIFGLLSGAATILVRISNGNQLNKALIDRYNIYAVFLIISLFVAAYYHYRHIFNKKYILVLCSSIFLILYITRLRHSKNIFYYNCIKLKQSMYNYHNNNLKGLNVKHFKLSARSFKKSIVMGNSVLPAIDDLLEYSTIQKLDQIPTLKGKNIQKEIRNNGIIKLKVDNPDVDVLGIGYSKNNQFYIYDKLDESSELILGDLVNRHTIFKMQFGEVYTEHDFDQFDYFYTKENRNRLLWYYTKDDSLYYSKL